MASDRGLVFKKRERLRTRHVKSVGNGAPLEPDVQRVSVVTLPLANLTRHVHVGEKVHLNANGSVASARLTPAAFDVETESARLVSPDPRLLGLSEEFPDVVEHPGIGGCVGSRGSTDRGLVDVDDLVHGLDALNRPMEPRRHLGPVHLLHQTLVQNLIDQRGLTGPGHPCHRHEAPRWDSYIQVSEVVLSGSSHYQVSAVARPSDLRHSDLFLS